LERGEPLGEPSRRAPWAAWIADLAALTSWTPSPQLVAALDESAAVRHALGDGALSRPASRTRVLGSRRSSTCFRAEDRDGAAATSARACRRQVIRLDGGNHLRCEASLPRCRARTDRIGYVRRNALV